MVAAEFPNMVQITAHGMANDPIKLGAGISIGIIIFIYIYKLYKKIKGN